MRIVLVGSRSFGEEGMGARGEEKIGQEWVGVMVLEVEA